MTRRRDRDKNTKTPGFFELHGLEGPEVDLAARWAAHDSRSGDLRVPIGFDADGAVVALDFSRWSSLDDHLLVVGATSAGTTTLLRTLALSLCITQHPSRAGFLAVEGKSAGREYAELGSVPHCRGHVTFSDEHRERTALRLARTLTGQIDRREGILQSTGMTSIEDYRNALVTTTIDDPDRDEAPELFVLVDNLSWLHGRDFDQTVGLLAAHGHHLGLRMVIGVPYRLWESLEPTGYFDSFTARVALGLPQRQATAVLGADVPDDLGSPGDAYVRRLGAQPIRVMIPTVDTSVTEAQLRPRC